MRKLFTFLTVTITFSMFTAVSAQSQFSVLHYFNDTTGGEPNGGLAWSGNMFYGMTAQGGANGKGCIYSMDTSGAGYADIFDFNGVNGASPMGDLIISGSTMYGMTLNGGANNLGCIFSIQTNGSGYNDLMDFNSTNGANPGGDLLLIGSTLYGMASQGGANGLGLVFSIQTNGNGFTDLLDFNGTNGSTPVYGSLIAAGNVMYGMTSTGGTKDSGCVFSIHMDGTGYADLHDFTGVNQTGYNPVASLVLSGSMLFGMTVDNNFLSGPNDHGTIFKVDTLGNNFKQLYLFTVPRNPFGSLIIKDSILYGTTTTGLVTPNGSVFSMDTSGIVFKTLHMFSRNLGGCSPMCALTQIGSELFGTTSAGGDSINMIYEHGLIFKLADSTITTGTDEVRAMSEELRVYPNPSNGVFTIKSSVLSRQWSVEVYNVLGEKVKSEELRANSEEIDLNNQPNGVYLYRVISNDGNVLGEGKLVIEK